MDSFLEYSIYPSNVWLPTPFRFVVCLRCGEVFWRHLSSQVSHGIPDCMEIFCGKNVIGCYCPAIKRKKRTCAWNVRKGNEQNKKKVINKDASFMQAKAYMFLRRKLADHFIVVWLSPKSIFTFVFSPHSFFDWDKWTCSDICWQLALLPSWQNIAPLQWRL